MAMKEECRISRPLAQRNPFREPYGRVLFEKLCSPLITKDGLKGSGPFPVEGGALATDMALLVMVKCGETSYVDEIKFVERAKLLLEKLPASVDPLTISIGALKEKIPVEEVLISSRLCPCVTRQIPADADFHDEGWYWTQACFSGLRVSGNNESRAVRFGGTIIDSAYLSLLLAMMNVADTEIVAVSPLSGLAQPAQPVRLDCGEWTAIVMGIPGVAIETIPFIL